MTAKEILRTVSQCLRIRSDNACEDHSQCCLAVGTILPCYKMKSNYLNLIYAPRDRVLSYWQNTLLPSYSVLTKPYDTATHFLCLERVEVAGSD